MNDLFYFTKSTITLRQIASVAETYGYATEYLAALNDVPEWLNVRYTADDFWQWMPLEVQGMYSGFTAHAAQCVSAYEPAAAFTVAHPVYSWPLLRGYLKEILAQYGGWIGNDTEDLQPTYTVDSIESLPYPAYIAALHAIQERPEYRSAFERLYNDPRHMQEFTRMHEDPAYRKVVEQLRDDEESS